MSDQCDHQWTKAEGNDNDPWADLDAGAVVCAVCGDSQGDTP